MIYTENTEKAMKLAFVKHKEEVDKAGIPYIIHPILVANEMDDEDSTVVALLHDVVEDTDVTFDDLRQMGFNDTVLNALKILTHNKNEQYMDYIKRLADNSIAFKVKLADLNHNSNFSRIRNYPELISKYTKKYNEAKQFLLSKIDK